MQYISPFQTLGIEAQDISPEGLKLAKKKLLAEFELSDSATILRGGKEMSKDEALKAFDNLGSTSDWYFHGLIAKDKSLSDFLNKQILSTTILYTGYTDTAFITWLSPYVAYSFQKIQLKAFREHQAGMVKHLWQEMTKFMDAYAVEEMEGSVEMYLRNRIETLDNIGIHIKNRKKFAYQEVKDYYNDGFMDCLSVLPAQFQWLRDSYAVSLYNFAVYTWNSAYYSRATDAINAASVLQLSPYEHNLVREGLTFFNGSNDWSHYFWEWEDRSAFDPKNIFTRAISWILWAISFPLVGIWRLWMIPQHFLENYIVGRIFAGIVRIFLSIGTFFYALFLVVFIVFGTISIILNNTSSHNNSTSTLKNGTTDSLNYEIGYLSMPKLIEQTKEAAHTTDISLLEYNPRRSKIEQDSLVEQSIILSARQKLYDTAWQNFILYDSLVEKYTFYQYPIKRVDKKSHKIISDTITLNPHVIDLYKKNFNRIVALNSSVHFFQKATGIAQGSLPRLTLDRVFWARLYQSLDSLKVADSTLNHMVTMPFDVTRK
jgi:hypothetical protein